MVAALAACNSLNGANDLTADLPTDPIGAPDRSLSEDGGTSSGSSGNASSSSSGGTNPTDLDGSTNPDAPSPPSRIRDITFEDNAIVHPVTGWDAVTGSPSVTSLNVIGGMYSMRSEATSSFGSISFAAADDLYVSLSLRLEGVGAGSTDAYFLRVTHGGGDPIEAYVSSTRDIHIVQGAKSITTMGAPADKTVYRLKLHLESTGKITIKLEGGGSSATTGGSATLGSSTKLEVGALSGGSMKAMFDDISLDRAMQP